MPAPPKPTLAERMMGARIDLPMIGSARRTNEWSQKNEKAARVKRDAEELAAMKAQDSKEAEQADAPADGTVRQSL